MKAISKLFLVLLSTILCIGCEKATEEQITESGETEDFYYVKFEATSDYYYIYGVSISLTGCGNFGFNVEGKSFSEIIGPASKGAVAKMSVTMTMGECQRTAIYVSKNNGPFALKRQSNANGVSYTIDF